MTDLTQAREILSAELARILERQIILGELPPGSRLVEEDIVRQYNVSRSPVREAFRSLEQEGLVFREVHRGVRVSLLSVEDLNEVYVCRLPLEGLAAELAGNNRTAVQIAAAEQEFRKLKLAGKGGNAAAFFEQNIRLSTSIYDAAGSRTLKRLLGSVGKQSLRYRYFAYLNAPVMMGESLEANGEIIRAIKAGRSRQARAVTEDIILRSWGVIRELMEELTG